MGQNMEVADQAAKMLCRPVDEVKAEWEKLQAGEFEAIENSGEQGDGDPTSLKEKTQPELLQIAKELGIAARKSEGKESLLAKITQRQTAAA